MGHGGLESARTAALDCLQNAARADPDNQALSEFLAAGVFDEPPNDLLALLNEIEQATVMLIPLYKQARVANLAEELPISDRNRVLLRALEAVIGSRKFLRVCR